MRLYMKQKWLSLLGDFDIYDENQRVAYHVKGKFAIGRKLQLIDKQTNREVAVVQQKLLSLLPAMDVRIKGRKVATISKKITLFRPGYHISQLGWRIDGDLWQHNYKLFDRHGNQIARIKKKFIALTDTFEVNIKQDEIDPTMVIAVVLAIDLAMDLAENKSKSSASSTTSTN